MVNTVINIQSLCVVLIKKLPLYYSSEYTFGSPAFYLPIPEARSNYDSTSAIELWLSVPRSLEVWLCRGVYYFCYLFINSLLTILYIQCQVKRPIPMRFDTKYGGTPNEEESVDDTK
jgi:hypothetical protein